MNSDSPTEQNEWVQRLLGFAAQFENEGILGLAQVTVEQTTNITFQVASAVTSTAFHIASEAGRVVLQQNHSEGGKERNLTCEEHKFDMEENETPFILKIAFQFTDTILATISPALSNKDATKYYSNRTDTRLIEDVDMFSTTSCSIIDDEFHDAHSFACDESIYFDANVTVSTCPESDNTNDSSSDDKSVLEDEEESQSCIIESIPDMLYTTPATTPPPTFFLDMPNALMSKIDDDINIPLMNCDSDSIDCFALNDGNDEPMQAVLDAIIRHSIELLADDNVSINWQPDDSTKKLLKQHTISYDNAQWTEILEEQVLKWTTQVENIPMLKTRGIVNMSPQLLRNLLLDCTRVREYNKCSLGKTDLHVFYLMDGGEARIVENAMQIPIVGGKVETLSLTHSRALLDDNAGFVIVSRSVKKDLDDVIRNPCISISSLRSIAGADTKTELTTLTSISLPVPKFLMHKVASYGAEDFFCNLRKVT